MATTVTKGKQTITSGRPAPAPVSASRPQIVPPAKASVPAIVEKKAPGLPAAAPAFLSQYREQDAGKGYSTKAEDGIVPFIDILQLLSPQIKKNNEKFIKGAEAGDIYVKGALEPIVGPEDGIQVQPCAFERKWVEWVPRSKGGGFVTRHDDKPADAVERPNPEDETRTVWVRSSNGNQLIDTRYHYVLLNGAPYVMAFKSTGHTVSREWTQLMKMLGGAAFERKYKVTTKLRTKGDNEWYVFGIDVLRDANGVPLFVETEAEYLAGQALCNSVMAGEKTADAETVEERDESYPDREESGNDSNIPF
jgi:hypothetical protein